MWIWVQILFKNWNFGLFDSLKVVKRSKSNHSNNNCTFPKFLFKEKEVLFQKIGLSCPWLSSYFFSLSYQSFKVIALVSLLCSCMFTFYTIVLLSCSSHLLLPPMKNWPMWGDWGMIRLATSWGMAKRFTFATWMATRDRLRSRRMAIVTILPLC